MNIKHLLGQFALVILAIAALSSCQKQKGATKLILDQTEFSIGEEGGFGKITYTIVNPNDENLEVSGNPTWVTKLTTAITGEVSFVIEPNYETNDRSAEIIVSYGAENASFTIKQDAFREFPTLKQLLGKKLKATFCEFFPKDTKMYKYKQEYGYIYTFDQNDNPVYVWMYQEDWAKYQADAYNENNPDNPIATPDDFRGVDYTVQNNDGSFTYTHLSIYNNMTLECWTGVDSPTGGAAVQDFTGEFTYNEETGIATFMDTHNAYYTHEVDIQFRKTTEGQITFEVLKFKNPEDHAFIEGYCHRFMLYCQKEGVEGISWQPSGKIVYYCDIEEII